MSPHVGPKTARSLNICTPLEASKGPKAKSAKKFILKAQFFALIFAQEGTKPIPIIPSMSI